MNVAATVRAGARQGLQRIVTVGRRVTAPSARAPARRPATPHGWHVAPPDFVGVGALGAAKGWWHAQIERHPNVARAPGSHAAVYWFGRFWAEEPPTDPQSDYAAWFPRPGGSIAGEWTPSYLSDVWVPPLLARAAPDARILVLLVDPLPRFLEAFVQATAEQPRSWNERDAIGAFQRGLHAEQLRGLFRAYPRHQVLVLQEEVCRDDSSAQLARTFEHIGLANDVDLAPITVEAPPAPRDPGDAVPESIRRAVSSAYAIEIEQLSELLPECDFDRWTVPRRPRHR